MEHEMSIEHHHRHSQASHQRTHNLHTRESLTMAIDQCHEQHGEQRARADNERRVGGCGVEHGGILGEEVERPAYNAQYHVNWTEDGEPVSTNATYKFIAEDDRTLVANFVKDKHTITFVNEGGGELQKSQVKYGETPKYVGDMAIAKVIVVPGRIVNVVLKK